ncbi:MAG: hypothetical protein AAGC60_20565 [Acidobacteriota bacterium]
MRPLEVLFLLLLTPPLVDFCLRREPAARWWLLVRLSLAAAGLVLLAHWLVEGWRWQLVPAYGVFLLIALRARRGERPPGSRRVSAVLAIPAVLVAALLGWALPVFELPAPGGPFPVGTMALEWLDESRREPFGPDRTAPRRLMARAWYPADASKIEGPPGRYLEGGPWFLSHWRLVETSSWTDAPMASSSARDDTTAAEPRLAGPWPVILWNHCYTCPVIESTMLMQELASHGFVVVSVAHPYEEVATVYPDGDLVIGDYGHMTAVRRQFPLPEVYAALAAAQGAEKEALFRNTIDSADLIEQSLRVWTDDSHSALDHLEQIEAHLGRPLDRTRLGVAGYSLGGVAAAQLCVERPEAVACLDVDCLVYGSMIDEMPHKPLMFLSSEAFEVANDVLFERTTAPAYHVTIADTTHQNFSDMHLQAPFLSLLSIPPALGEAVGIVGPVLGSLDPERASTIENAYVLAFFERHLRGGSASGSGGADLDGPSPAFPEVSVVARNPASPNEGDKAP